jgi:hypothetical protein
MQEVQQSSMSQLIEDDPVLRDRIILRAVEDALTAAETTGEMDPAMRERLEQVITEGAHDDTIRALLLARGVVVPSDGAPT